MAQPAYVGPSLAELGRLSDEMWFLAGDTSLDSSWYTKRARLAAIYASSGTSGPCPIIVRLSVCQSARLCGASLRLEIRIEQAAFIDRDDDCSF